MPVISQLHKAKFDGFEFLVNSETSDGGKKVVSHEYPNSDYRFSEELGRIPQRFTINAIVYGELNRRLAFEEVLSRPGLRTLVHPIYGTVEVMATNYSVASDQVSIGEFKFAITFERSKANITPSEVESKPQKVTDRAAMLRTNISNGFRDVYQPPQAPFDFAAIQERFTAILGVVQSALSLVSNPDPSAIGVLTTTIAKATPGAYSTIQSAETLADTLNDIFDQLLNTTADPADLRSVWESLSSYDVQTVEAQDGYPIKENIPNTYFLPVDTAQRARKARGLSAMSEYLRLMALAGQYESSVYTDFTTSDELETARQGLSDSFNQKIRRDQNLAPDTAGYAGASRCTSIASDSAVQAAANDLVSAAKEVFEQKLESAWRTQSVITAKTSVALLTYQYYSSLDLIDTVLNLNPGNKASFVNGPTTLVS